jgi:hypothetical protein
MSANVWEIRKSFGQFFLVSPVKLCNCAKTYYICDECDAGAALPLQCRNALRTQTAVEAQSNDNWRFA